MMNEQAVCILLLKCCLVNDINNHISFGPLLKLYDTLKNLQVNEQGSPWTAKSRKSWKAFASQRKVGEF